MSNLKIKNLSIGETVDIFLLVSSMEDKIAGNGKPYVEFTFEDGVGKINAKMWNNTKASIPDIFVGEVAKVRAKVGEWNDNLQLNVTMCRAISSKDNINKEDFVRKAPIEAEEMYNFIMGVVSKYDNADLKKLTSAILEKNKKKLMYFPGAKTVHHDVKSGLLYHMSCMLQTGIKTAEVYGEAINKDLFYSGIILHDIGKVEELDSDNCGKTEDYTKAGKLLGHLIQGIKIVSFTSKELGIPEEVSLLIEHMIASHHGDESTGALKKPMFLEADLLHAIDMIDSRVYMYKEVNDKTEDNNFSEKQFFMGNIQVYKHNLK